MTKLGIMTYIYIYTLYIHTYVRTYVHTYIHTYVRTYIHTYMALIENRCCLKHTGVSFVFPLNKIAISGNIPILFDKPTFHSVV